MMIILLITWAVVAQAQSLLTSLGQLMAEDDAGSPYFMIFEGGWLASIYATAHVI